MTIWQMDKVYLLDDKLNCIEVVDKLSDLKFRGKCDFIPPKNCYFVREYDIVSSNIESEIWMETSKTLKTAQEEYCLKYNVKNNKATAYFYKIDTCKKILDDLKILKFKSQKILCPSILFNRQDTVYVIYMDGFTLVICRAIEYTITGELQERLKQILNYQNKDNSIKYIAFLKYYDKSEELVSEEDIIALGLMKIQNRLTNKIDSSISYADKDGNKSNGNKRIIKTMVILTLMVNCCMVYLYRSNIIPKEAKRIISAKTTDDKKPEIYSKLGELYLSKNVKINKVNFNGVDISFEATADNLNDLLEYSKNITDDGFKLDWTKVELKPNVVGQGVLH